VATACECDYLASPFPLTFMRTTRHDQRATETSTFRFTLTISSNVVRVSRSEQVPALVIAEGGCTYRSVGNTMRDHTARIPK
jgi:hypothetical protein